MTDRPSRLKIAIFRLIAAVPALVTLEVASYLLMENMVPSRIRARTGHGKIDFYLPQQRKKPDRPPVFVRESAKTDRRNAGEPARLMMFHPVLGWDYPPGISYRDVDGILYSHDQNGSRRVCTSYGNTSVATYGDSFTYGHDVGDEDTWQTFLAKRLESNVLNFGVGGYGTDQAYLKYELQRHIHTRIVMLGIWPENINRVVNVYRPFYRYGSALALTKPIFTKDGNHFKLVPNPLKSVADVSKLRDADFLKKLGKLDYWYQFDKRLPAIAFPYTLSLLKWREPVLGQIALSLSRTFPSASRVQYPWNLFDEPKPFAIMRHIVDLFVETARTRNSFPIVVILPHRDDVRELMEYRISRIAGLVNYLEAKHYPYINVIRSIADRNPTPTELERWFAGHTSKEGNKIVADIVSRWLERNMGDANFHISRPAGYPTATGHRLGQAP